MVDFKCGKCGACCRHWDLPVEAEAKELAKQITLVPFKGESVMVRVFGRCRYLRKDNTCLDYKNRPQVCRDFNCNVGINGRVQ